jgi:hypothetical protein
MRKLPIQVSLGLGIRPCPHLRHHQDDVLAGHQTGDPGRQMNRRFGADHSGQRGKPIPDLCRLIVDNIVDAARLAPFDSPERRRRGVFDMDKRPPSAAVADQRHAAMPYLLDHGLLKHSSARTVERAIAQGDPFGLGRTGDRPFQVSDRL